MPLIRRWRIFAFSFLSALITIHYLTSKRNTWTYRFNPSLPEPADLDSRVHWSAQPDRYPVRSFIPLPTGVPASIPQVQAAPPKEDAKQKGERLKRLAAVKESFQHSWAGYKQHAWLRDEVAPISGLYKDTFGGWAATLVDSLDSLWIFGLKDEFEKAVKAAESIDFTTTEERSINVFETTIRYLGGFLAAYDISEGKYPSLLAKAVQVGELLMGCFDTPNRMPMTRWDWQRYVKGEAQKAPQRVLVSEIGSLSLEFTRLTQLTGDPKYYDAIQRISNAFEDAQNTTMLPGMWPVSIDASGPSFSQDTHFTLGGMSDSLYEYLPKQFTMLGGLLSQPKTLYENFIPVAKEHMFFRIYNPENKVLSVSGDIRISGTEKLVKLKPRGQHLTCFAGGMVGLAAKIFARPDDMALADELTSGCVWAYDASANGIAPEIFSVMPCPKNHDCEWSESLWHDALSSSSKSEESVAERQERIKNIISDRRFPPGFTQIEDRRYILRPEAIESVFLMWRMTGDRKWQEAAWRMFTAIEKVSRTDIAAAAIQDITIRVADGEKADSKAPRLLKLDSMESFWLAETLKYFYLCFADWDLVDLDEYVLNTEAHPFKRPK